MTKAAGTAMTAVKIINNFKVGLYHRDKDQLCNTVTLFDAETVAAVRG